VGESTSFLALQLQLVLSKEATQSLVSTDN
jgi:hypothetical protein